MYFDIASILEDDVRLMFPSRHSCQFAYSCVNIVESLLRQRRKPGTDLTSLERIHTS